MADWIHGAQLDRIRETQHQHTAELRAIREMLEVKPKKSLPITIDWPKLLPRIVWGLLVVGLAATQMLPVQQAIKIIGFLLSS
jgi:hypothetical protein